MEPRERFLSRPDEAPVFVDPTGRRASGVHRALGVAACAFALWVAALAIGAIGPAGLPGIRIPPVVADHPSIPALGPIHALEPADFPHTSELAREPLVARRPVHGEAT